MHRDDHYAGKTAYRGEIAANYERDRASEPVWQQEQAWMAAWAQRVPKGARLLDVPAGTGRFLEIWRSRGACVTAADVSEDMLAALTRRWPADGTHLIVERADAEALPYRDKSFDFVVCWRLFHLLPPAAAERVLCEFARVCAGEIVLEIFNVSQEAPMMVLARAVKAKLRKWLARSSSGAGGQTPWSHITSYPQSERALRRRFARCGLRVVDAETLAEYHGTPTRVYFLRAEAES